MYNQSMPLEAWINVYENNIDKILMLWGVYLLTAVVLGAGFFTLTAGQDVTFIAKGLTVFSFSLITLLHGYELMRRYQAVNSVAKEMLSSSASYDFGDPETENWLKSVRIVPLTAAFSILLVSYGVVMGTILSA